MSTTPDPFAQQCGLAKAGRGRNQGKLMGQTLVQRPISRGRVTTPELTGGTYSLVFKSTSIKE